jgi:UDP-N-acetylmuramyl pentapeptide phosphotransferase/UDP-N-acetylglucosamine-1-phosphate transferase
MAKLIGLSAASFVLSYFTVRGTRYLAERHAILDVPNERSSHTGSVPRGGGAAIVVVTLLGIWLYQGLNSKVNILSVVAYTVGAMLIAGVSWLDDWRSQPNWLRFLVHSAGALLAIYGFGFLPIGGLFKNSSAVGWLGPIITYFWIVGLTNAYNFMDGIDGIAGGQAVVAGLGWAAVGWLGGQYFIVVFGLLLAATSLGFLCYNWPPARIFMGDVGSAFLGYTFAVLPLMFNSLLSRGESGLNVIMAAILPLWPFVFDSTFTILRRLRRGENVFSAHRSHLYQRLVIAGHTHGSVSLLYCALATLGAVLAVGWVLNLRSVGLITAIALPLIWLTLWIFVARQEQKQARELRIPRPTFFDPV